MTQKVLNLSEIYSIADQAPSICVAEIVARNLLVCLLCVVSHDPSDLPVRNPLAPV